MRLDNPVARLLEPPARLVAILGCWWLTGLAFLTCAMSRRRAWTR
jgi:hypothetical protein